MTFDPNNTKDWQRDGSTVFPLEEIPGPFKRASTHNKFTIHVAGNRYSNQNEVDAVAERLVRLLNSDAP